MFVGARISGIGNRSDFAARFGVRLPSGPSRVRGASGKFVATAKSDGVAMALIETSAPKPATRQEKANHTVLCMSGPEVWRAGRDAHPRTELRFKAHPRDRIRAPRWRRGQVCDRAGRNFWRQHREAWTYLHNFIDWITGLLNFSAETYAERLTRQREYRNRIHCQRPPRGVSTFPAEKGNQNS